MKDGKVRRAPAPRRIALAAAVLGLVAGVTAAGRPEAGTGGGAAREGAPAAGCALRQQQPHKDTLGNVFTFDLYCDNLASDMYGRAAYDAPVTGRLKLSPSWFACWTQGDAPPGESKIWYYTQGDEVASRPTLKGWGLVPARVVESQKHPFPGLPRCSWY
ncbi:hypothetical protein AB0I49_13620 [Streptomyces sp. NPDC050617]|uniref:hypothetical protein n=1 Tax=Streptomyces sp. NPDC050617 TaxID=3154628 RepID=UPI003431F13F